MARKTRKERSDSTHAATLAAGKPDNSTLRPPKVAGDEILDEHGRAFLADAYRADPDKWTPADLLMLVEAAFTHQQMIANRALCSMLPPIETMRNGVTTTNAHHRFQADLDKRLRSIFQALGIRGRDGAKPVQTKAAPAIQGATTSGDVLTFEEYLHADD